MIIRAYRWFLIALFIPTILMVVSSASADPAEDSKDNETLEYPMVLSLDDCHAIAWENNIGLKRVRLGIEAGVLERIRYESMFDPGFELDLSARGSDSPDTMTSSGSSSQVDLGMRYIQPTWQGSSWVFSFDQGRSTGSYTVGPDPISYTSYSTQLGLAYSLPILEGYGERINRVGVQRANLGVMRNEIAINEAERNLHLAIVQVYIQAVLAAKQIEVAELSLETTENLVEEVRALIDVGQLASYELLAAQAGLAERREALLNAETGLAVTLDNLKEIIGLPITDEIDIDGETLQPVYTNIDAEELFSIAQRNRSDLMDIDLQMEIAQLDLFLAVDRRQSSLNWNTVLGLAGQGEDYADSYSDLDNFSWYTGIEYKIPLGGNRAAEVDVTGAQLALDQLALERIDFLRNLQLDVRSASEDFQNALLRIDVTTQGLEVQEVKMECERVRHELGLITARDLLEFDLDLASARLAYESALADALLALAKLEYLINAPLLNDALSLGNTPSGTEVSE